MVCIIRKIVLISSSEKVSFSSDASTIGVQNAVVPSTHKAVSFLCSLTFTLFIDREREKIRLEFPKDTLWALEMVELPLMQRESPDRCRIER